MPEATSNGSPIPSHPFRWLPEFLEFGRKRVQSQARLLGLSLLVGVISGIGAIVFYVACQFVFHYALDGTVGYRPTTPGGEPAVFADSETVFRPWLLLIVPTVGGLLSGWIVFTIAPEAEGHGTDAAIASYHYRQGHIRPRVPLVKIISSALTISTGGSGGREGPIAQIGAGFGSYLGALLRLRPADRRTLMAAGMGAGVAAIFRAPLAGALFAAEVLYSSPDFESEVIMPSALASISAYCTFGLAFGWTPLFSLSPEILNTLTFNNPLELLSYTILAFSCIVLAMLYTRSFYWLTYLFHQIRLPRHVVPAIGAFLSGLLGLGLYYLFGEEKKVLAVLSFGYGSLQDAMTLTPNDSTLNMALILLSVALGKIVTTGMTIGSGGSGGVFGPSMVIGGCGGGALGIILHRLWPALAPHPTNFVIVGMAGFFAAAAKTPFSTLVIVSEMTGSYSLLLPTLWVCTVAFLLSDEQSIYSSQVESHTRSPAHQAEFVRGMLGGLTVGQFIRQVEQPTYVHIEDHLKQVLDRMSTDPHAVLPVTDSEGRLLGVVSVEEVFLATQIPDAPSVVLVADLMRSDVVPLQLNDSVDRAMELFAENDLLELPVVNNGHENRVVGVIGRAEIAGTYLRHVQGAGKSMEFASKINIE
jgi:CIC family chloride channel protein